MVKKEAKKVKREAKFYQMKKKLIKKILSKIYFM